MSWDASSAGYGDTYSAERVCESERSGWETQGLVVATGDEAESFDHKVMVFAFGQAGDGDRANDSGARDVDGEAASVGGVVFQRQVVPDGEGQAGLFEQTANVVRTLVEARDDVDLARDPALVVGGGAGQRAVEELLVRRSEAADVDDDA